MTLPLTARQDVGQSVHSATQGSEAERKGSNNPVAHTWTEIVINKGLQEGLLKCRGYTYNTQHNTVLEVRQVYRQDEAQSINCKYV